MQPLADVVKDLRSELYAAMAAGDDEPLQFELGDITLELNVAVTREGGVGAKLRFWVVELGADGKKSNEATQKITLKLTPRLGSSDRPARITGEAVAGEGSAPAGS